MGQACVHIINNTDETIRLEFCQKNERRGVVSVHPGGEHSETYDTSAWTHVWCDVWRRNGKEKVFPLQVLQGGVTGHRTYTVNNDFVTCEWH